MKNCKLSTILLVLAAILFIVGLVFLIIGIKKKSECKGETFMKSFQNAYPEDGTLRSWHGLTGDGDEEDPGLGWVL